MIVVVGLSHRTAPIEVRERLSLSREVVPAFLKELTADGTVGEGLLVSTCNRVELVAAGTAMASDLQRVTERCVRAFEAHAPGISRHMYRHAGGDGVKHLFRVASSLDSLVRGEPQILGQVKDAFEVARHAGTLGPILHRTVPRAIRTAKRVRNETLVGAGQVSVPSVAVDLTRQIFGELRGRTVLLVGSGEMAEAVARLLGGAGCRILVLGRTREKVEALAQAVAGEARLWPDLRAVLVEADVVITSTSAPGFVIDKAMVQAARKSRRGRAQTFIDLAVPRDVDPAGGELDDVFIYNIDDFSRVVAETLSARSREAELGERIVEEETRGYERWADAEQATPLIVRFREEVRRAMRLELERSVRGRLKHLGRAEREALETMLEAAGNRILHSPTMRLREAAAERKSGALSLEELSLALGELFGLSESAPRPEAAPPSRPGCEPDATAILHGSSLTEGSFGEASLTAAARLDSPRERVDSTLEMDEKSHVTGTLGKWPSTR